LALWPVYQQWQALAAEPAQSNSGFQQADATMLERLTNQVKAATATQQADQTQLKSLQTQQQLSPLFQDYLLVTAQVDPLLARLPDITIADRERQRLAGERDDLQQQTQALEQQYATNGQMPRTF